MIPRYSPPDIFEIWSDSHRLSLWTSIELAACLAMENHGIVPSGTSAVIRSAVYFDDISGRTFSRLSLRRVADLEKTTHHDFIAFLAHLEELAGDPARWIHHGMTSSDVVDTALAIQIREVSDLLLQRIFKFSESLANRASEHSSTPIVGRSHGMHAEPTTVGFILAGHRAEVLRAYYHLKTASEGIGVGKLSGAVGTYAHFPPEVEEEVMHSFGLRPESVSTQVVARDRHAAWMQSLALVACSIERIALTIRHWQRTEVGEAEEGFKPGQMGSSAMPHKRNPIVSENLCGLSRLVRGYVGPMLENCTLWHERDISHSSVERIAIPDSSCILGHMLDRAIDLIDNLVFFPERMSRNLEMSGGLIFSESVLLALIDLGCPRQEAYKAVQRCSMMSWNGEGSFRSLLSSDPYIGPKIGKNLDDLFDATLATAHMPLIVRRALDIKIIK